MSTRATIYFKDQYSTSAIIYRHCDGYPESDYGVLADLNRFFEAVEAQTKDTRYSDPAYLAAKFVVWQAAQNASDPSRPLDFLSLGILMEDPGDIEFRYTVQCSDLVHAKRPKVTFEAV